MSHVVFDQATSQTNQSYHTQMRHLLCERKHSNTISWPSFSSTIHIATQQRRGDSDRHENHTNDNERGKHQIPFMNDNIIKQTKRIWCHGHHLTLVVPASSSHHTRTPLQTNEGRHKMRPSFSHSVIISSIPRLP